MNIQPIAVLAFCTFLIGGCGESPTSPKSTGSSETQLTPPIQSRSANKESSSKEDILKRLQGDWICVTEEMNRKAFTPTELKLRNRRITINGTSFKMSRVQNEKVGTYEGRFDFNPATNPWEFNFAGRGPSREPIDLIGICNLEGDTFKVCYVYVQEGVTATRPEQFSAQGPRSGFNFVYKRDNN